MAINKRKPPIVGDRIEHTCSLNGKFEGVVTQMTGIVDFACLGKIGEK